MNTQNIPADPYQALTCALLARARRDAQAGDLSALAWLVACGAEMAEAVAPGGSDVVLAFAQRALATVDAGTVQAAWWIA